MSLKRFAFGASAIAVATVAPVYWARSVGPTNHPNLTIQPFVLPETFSKPLYNQGFLANAFDPDTYRTFQFIHKFILNLDFYFVLVGTPLTQAYSQPSPMPLNLKTTYIDDIQ
ncbi:hypothetical protein BDR26DRAFT_1009009 [Obelidium mucronatum]|nr:hypothetical protein BDR26DRAFT_1009009 [Obelidium mucronatum]